ncbi:myb/SANT-like DNA-binding domain-containing protein 1 [Ischnura elegans]|uniref:myb/SANT-like DNA-binding domain-containing protein 1 n=1 Tax=Ischnura elegans TaxID=197161 RepID=UPI001ED89E27|nr:myb/SANT-like DNA-binding domain-containing protein 1 [Ischnura elegans]
MSSKGDKRSSNFSPEEVEVLIGIWGNFLIQGKFEKNLKHNNVWKLALEEFKFVVGDEGEKIQRYNRTWEELKVKVANLKTEYTKEKAKIKSGSSPSTWRHFNSMNAVLGSTDYHNEALVMETLCRSPEAEQTLIVMPDIGHSSSSCSEGSNSPVPTGMMEETRLRRDSTSSDINITQHRRRKAPSTHLMQELLETEKKVLSLIEKRAKVVEEAEVREARYLELQEIASAREERLSGCQERALLAMESYFSSRTPNHGEKGRCEVVPSGSVVLPRVGPGTSSLSLRGIEPGVRRHGEAIVLPKSVLELGTPGKKLSLVMLLLSVVSKQVYIMVPMVGSTTQLFTL